MSFQLNEIYNTNNPDYKIMITNCYFPSEGKNAHVLRVFYKHEMPFKKGDCFFNCVPEFNHSLVNKWALQFQKDPVKSLAEQLKNPIWNKSKDFIFGKWLLENGFKDMVK